MRRKGANMQRRRVISVCLDNHLRLRTFAPQSLGIIVRREDFSGARTALSACSRRIGAYARTKLSALLWLRRRRVMSLR